MTLSKLILTILVCFLPHATALAQGPQSAGPSRDTSSREVTIIIQQQQLRFSAPASTQEIRLEVFNKAGESVYDSGFVAGAEISWALRNAGGGDIPGGLYAYTLTIKDANFETPAARRGHLILERGRDQLWVTGEGAIGAEESPSGGELTVSSGAERSVAGARIGRTAAARSTLNLDFFGTPGRIPMFTGSDFLADSVIWQDFNGRIGIGTQRPGAALLTVSGQIETTSGGIKFPNGSVQTIAGISQVIRNATLTGDGTSASPLGVNIPALNLLSSVTTDATLDGTGTTVSPLGIANGGVTGSNIAPGQVVKSLNGLFDNVSLSAGSNITITPSGNSLSIAAPNQLSSVTHDGTLAGNGTSASNLGVAIPLTLLGSSLPSVLDVRNGGGEGIFVIGGHKISDTTISAAIDARGSKGTGLGGSLGLLAVGGEDSNAVGGDGIWAFGGGGSRGGVGIFASGGAGIPQGLAGRFDGNVSVTGNLSKGGGSFKIDHPLDPANKYLYHSFVESPDMMNIYNGVARLDANGEAVVELPEWFEALNKEFRYLLTPVGAPMPGLYIAEEVSGNRFRIAGGQPGLKVSWQVTGIRQDAYANKHRIPVEEEKSERERGYYLHPEVFNKPEEKSVEWARYPEMMREIERRRQEAESRRREKENDR